MVAGQTLHRTAMIRSGGGAAVKVHTHFLGANGKVDRRCGWPAAPAHALDGWVPASLLTRHSARGHSPALAPKWLESRVRVGGA